MDKFTSRFFGEIVPGLTLVIGSTNSGKSSVLMNDAKDARNHVPVDFINLEMCPKVVDKIFDTMKTNYGLCVYGPAIFEDSGYVRLLDLITKTSAKIIYVDYLGLLLGRNKTLSYFEELNFALHEINSFAIKFNKSVIVTYQAVRNALPNEFGNISKSISDNCSKIFLLSRENRIITVNGKSFELDKDRNLTEVIEKKEQTLLEAIQNINDEIDSIAIFPEDHGYRLTHVTDGLLEEVRFLGQRIFHSDDDQRFYNEDTDEYESYETFLKRVVEEISKDVYSIFCKISP